jgi:hypothetical protein
MCEPHFGQDCAVSAVSPPPRNEPSVPCRGHQPCVGLAQAVGRLHRPKWRVLAHHGAAKTQRGPRRAAVLLVRLPRRGWLAYYSRATAELQQSYSIAMGNYSTERWCRKKPAAGIAGAGAGASADPSGSPGGRGGRGPNPAKEPPGGG